MVIVIVRVIWVVCGLFCNCVIVVCELCIMFIIMFCVMDFCVVCVMFSIKFLMVGICEVMSDCVYGLLGFMRVVSVLVFLLVLIVRVKVSCW